MIRRYNLGAGDNASAYASLRIYNVYGSGIIHIDIGWRPSAVQVGFGRQFLRVYKGNVLKYNEGSYGVLASYDEWNDGDEAQVRVRSNDPFSSNGWWLEFKNLPGLLDINYYCQ